MRLNKRSLLKYSAAVGSLGITGSLLAASPHKQNSSSNKELKDITTDVQGISPSERMQRIAKAQSMMQDMRISALILEPGAAMDYFSGIQWWRSERLTALIIPREGKIAVVCPQFEEPSIRESLAIDSDIRVWQEHESPFLRVQQILTDKKLNKGSLGFEHSVRYFVLRGIMEGLPSMNDVSAEPVTRGCRMFKTQHEIQLMHKANEITLKSYAHVWPQLLTGMTSTEANNLMQSTQAKFGGKGIWAMTLFNQASAYPHGTKKTETLRDGSIVLMDCGCNVHGYQSDISRTFVFGSASKRQREVWGIVKKGQQLAFKKAQLGGRAGLVDDAVRAYYESLGFGPGYKTPGLSHRTGHGIGMEVHESVNFVHGEETILKPGMCFSNEPGLYILGEFGVRLEDCIYMSKKGPRWFTHPAESLDEPIGRISTL